MKPCAGLNEPVSFGMPVLRTLFILAFVVSLAGCAIFSRNLSNVPPFSGYTGRIVELREPVVIVEDIGSYSPYSPFELVRDVRNRPTIMHLASKERVCIRFVHLVNAFDSAWVVAVGSTIPHDGSRPIRFEYFLGSQNGEIYRAPWEDLNTPKKRHIEF
jgi:hypothetical protein